MSKVEEIKNAFNNASHVGRYGDDNVVRKKILMHNLFTLLQTESLSSYLLSRALNTLSLGNRTKNSKRDEEC